TRVDELVRREIRFRVARKDRSEPNIGRAQQRRSADVMRGAWNLCAVEGHSEGLPTPAREIDATLYLRDPGNLPTVEELASYLIPHQVSKVVRVSCVEDMGA